MAIAFPFKSYSHLFSQFIIVYKWFYCSSQQLIQHTMGPFNLNNFASRTTVVMYFCSYWMCVNFNKSSVGRFFKMYWSISTSWIQHAFSWTFSNGCSLVYSEGYYYWIKFPFFTERNAHAYDVILRSHVKFVHQAIGGATVLSQATKKLYIYCIYTLSPQKALKLTYEPKH